MILHVNESQRRAILRSFDARLSGIRRRQQEGKPNSHDEADELLIRLMRRELSPLYQREKSRAS